MSRSGIENSLYRERKLVYHLRPRDTYDAKISVIVPAKIPSFFPPSRYSTVVATLSRCSRRRPPRQCRCGQDHGSFQSVVLQFFDGELETFLVSYILFFADVNIRSAQSRQSAIAGRPYCCNRAGRSKATSATLASPSHA